jgi:hypothetical protein
LLILAVLASRFFAGILIDSAHHAMLDDIQPTLFFDPKKTAHQAKQSNRRHIAASFFLP